MKIFFVCFDDDDDDNDDDDDDDEEEEKEDARHKLDRDFGHSLLHNSFLSHIDLFRILNDTQLHIHEHVPAGVKENVYFVVDNTRNQNMRDRGSKSNFWDDCGELSFPRIKLAAQTPGIEP